MTAETPTGHARATPLWRDLRVLRIAAQILVVAIVGTLVVFMVGNMLAAMDERGLGFGFSFLTRQAGFEIPESPISYSATSTYARAFLVGLLNTLFVSIVGIVLATILGVLVGVARLSPNWLLRNVTGAYVELMRNTPLLVQLFVIYFTILQLPTVAETFRLGDIGFLNQRGLSLPGPQAGDALGVWLAFVAAGVFAAIGCRWIANRREERGQSSLHLRAIGLVALIGLPVIGWFAVGGAPLTFELPVAERFNIVGGLALSPEFTALLTGLVIYTAAFIGEIVRGGIQAVRRGQVEAARAVGLSEAQVLRLVVFPQAMRIIVPPLTSQYLNLTKNSSLAVAIGYPDLFKIGQTMSNQTGQPVAVMALVMGTYLAISLATSFVMNLYNRRVQVAER